MAQREYFGEAVEARNHYLSGRVLFLIESDCIESEGQTGNDVYGILIEILHELLDMSVIIGEQ